MEVTESGNYYGRKSFILQSTGSCELFVRDMHYKTSTVLTAVPLGSTLVTAEYFHLSLSLMFAGHHDIQNNDTLHTDSQPA